MLNLSRIMHILDKYMEKLLKEMLEHEHGSTDESVVHTEQQAKAGRGDQAARQYLISFIKPKVVKVVSKQDLKEIKSVVIEEYKKLIKYKDMKIEETENGNIDYYDLICKYIKNKEMLEEIDLEKITGIDEFTQFVYQFTYGAGYIDNLLQCNLNNIEIHGTRMIRVETNTGVWRTINDYRFLKDEEIIRVAKRLLAEDHKTDITATNCEMEGMLLNGVRISIALRPGCKENMIFSKNFDAANVNTIEDLVQNGTITKEMKRELEIYAKGRANIVFIGGVNTGKTTVLRSYVGLIPSKYKIGIVENDFETDWQGVYPQKDFAILKETEKYSLSDQFKRMLRFNRNIIGIGEARGAEVEQWIEAATRGSDGSFMTMHTRTPHDFINNVVWMCLQGGQSVDIRILRYRIASAVDIIVRLWHSQDGKRIVDEICEVETIHDNLDKPYEIKVIYKKDINTNTVKKVGCISKQLAEKFTYYNVTREELKEIQYQ